MVAWGTWLGERKGGETYRGFSVATSKAFSEGALAWPADEVGGLLGLNLMASR